MSQPIKAIHETDPIPPPFPFPAQIDPTIQSDLIGKVFNNDLTALESAVQSAVAAGVSEMTDWGIKDAKTFLLYASGMLNWVPTETCNGKEIYYALCVFYFVLDQPALAPFSTPILPSSYAKPIAPAPLSAWTVQFANQIGSWMDTETSLTADSISSFQKSPLYNYDDALVPSGGFTTFNQLFSRHLKPGMRPISCPNDDRVVVYPADSTFDGTWPIDNTGQVVFIKGIPWPIADLLDGSQYASVFNGGTFMHAFLNTFDYHRQHAPVSGTVVEAEVIQGLCYLQVITDPITGRLAPVRGLNPNTGLSDDKEAIQAPDDPGYQFLQARGLVIIDNPLLGKVAVLPIGMAQVSSVVLSVKVGDVVQKGDEISCFEFGGSDICLVFESDAQVEILGATGTDAQGKMTTKQKYLVGMPLGFSNLPTPPKK